MRRGRRRGWDMCGRIRLGLRLRRTGFLLLLLFRLLARRRAGIGEGKAVLIQSVTLERSAVILVGEVLIVVVGVLATVGLRV